MGYDPIFDLEGNFPLTELFCEDLGERLGEDSITKIMLLSTGTIQFFVGPTRLDTIPNNRVCIGGYIGGGQNPHLAIMPSSEALKNISSLIGIRNYSTIICERLGASFYQKEIQSTEELIGELKELEKLVLS